MRNKLISALTATCLAFSLTSCLAGPHQLRRTVDDWDAKMYASSPLIDGILWFPVPMYPILNWGAMIGDFFVGDAYSFWFHDVWDGKGTGFEHFKVEANDGKMGSLLNDNAGWLKVTK